MTITDKFGEDIILSEKESGLLANIKNLFRRKDADFRIAFINEAMAEYCKHCGSCDIYQACRCVCDD